MVGFSDHIVDLGMVIYSLHVINPGPPSGNLPRQGFWEDPDQRRRGQESDDPNLHVNGASRDLIKI